MGNDGPTLGEVLRTAADDESAAWCAVALAAAGMARRLRHRWSLDGPRCDDLAQEATVAAARDSFAALRRRDPETPLDAWLTLTERNLLRCWRRRERPEDSRRLANADARVDPTNDGPGEDDAGRRAGAPNVEALLGLLPPEQDRVVRGLLAAGTERAAAAHLGTTRQHVHDVKRRAMRRMQTQQRWEPPADTSDRSWASAAECRAAASGNDTSARLFRMYVNGTTRREIAAAIGLTESAVRGRVSRARRLLLGLMG